MNGGRSSGGKQSGQGSPHASELDFLVALFKRPAGHIRIDAFAFQVCQGPDLKVSGEFPADILHLFGKGVHKMETIIEPLDALVQHLFHIGSLEIALLDLILEAVYGKRRLQGLQLTAKMRK
jgi:hypothetical protein